MKTYNDDDYDVDSDNDNEINIKSIEQNEWWDISKSEISSKFDNEITVHFIYILKKR